MRKLLYRPDGHPMTHADIYRAMGLDPKKKLPDEGVLAVRMIDGVAVVIERKIPGKAQDGERTRAQCPECRRWFGFARLRQHSVVHAALPPIEEVKLTVLGPGDPLPKGFGRLVGRIVG